MKKSIVAGVTAAGWLLGVWSGARIEAELSVVARTPAPEAAPEVAVPSRASYREALVSRDIFGLGAPRVTTVEALPMEATLLATVVSVDPTRSSALVSLPTGARGVGVGDSLTAQITVIDIQPRQVVVAHDGRLVTLTMTQRSGGRAVEAEVSTVRREEIDGLISRGGGGIRVVPHKGADGAQDGYRISGIRRNSLLYRLGAKNGDVVHSANGHALDSLEAVVAAQRALSEADAVHLEITRRGKRQTLSVSVE